MKKPAYHPNLLGKALLTGVALGLLVYLCVTLYLGTLPFSSVVVVLLVATLLTLLILPVIQKNR